MDAHPERVQQIMAEFRWLGHNCFRIKSREALIVTDPVDRATGYLVPKQMADIVTISHGHPEGSNLSAVKLPYQAVNGPGEYEMHEVFLSGIRTHHDTDGGKKLGHNTIYLFDVEGIRICHLGDLGHVLSEEQVEAVGDCGVLLIPAGGGDVISPEQAAEVVTQLGPKIVIPMRFATDIGDTVLGSLETFAKALGIPLSAPEEKLVLRSSDVVEPMRMVVLTPEAEAAKR